MSKLVNRRKMTYAPVAFSEKSNYMIIGDKFVRVLSFVKYPDLFIEGLLAPLVTQTAFDMDIVVESTDLDLASAIKKQMEHTDDLYQKSKDPQEQARLKNKYENFKKFVERSVKETSSTVNTIVNLYIKADTLEELDDITKKVRADLESGELKIRSKSIPNMNQNYYRKNSPLFIRNNLSKDEDFLNGQPMSSISAAALFPFVFDTLEDPEGTLIGRERTNGGKISFYMKLIHLLQKCRVELPVT